MVDKKRWVFNGKKTAIICALVLAIGAVGFLNYQLTNNNKKDIDTQEVVSEQDSIDVFSAYRDERSLVRTQEISYIDSVVSSAETDELTKNQAQEKKLSLVSNMENELTIEGLIATKMNTDVIATVKEDAVNIVVNKKSLTEDEVSQIVEIVKTQTGQNSQNIKIMPQG